MKPMIHRIVLFQFKPEITSMEIDVSMGMMKAWRGIPALKQITVAGNRQGRENQEYHVALAMAFADQAGLDEFSAHPAHTAFIEHITQQASNILVFDYEN